MLDIIIDILGFSALLSVVIACAYAVCLLIAAPKSKGRMIVLLPCGDANDCVRMLYSAHLRIMFFSGCCKGEIIAVDMGMNGEQRKLCDEVCGKYRNTHIITLQELSTYLSKDEVQLD